MNFLKLIPCTCAAATLLLSSIASAQTVPGDTYFSLAVTENSHNHNGARRLFLNFQEPPFALADQSVGEISSVRVLPGDVVLDGSAADWNSAYFTTVHALPQSNYPLSEYIDAIPTELLVGSAWDATHVYFMVQWEDAGHNASTRKDKWIFGDQGNGEAGWNKQVHVGATAGAPNAMAVNASGHVLAGTESEDRVFFMFPITDVEDNFSPTGAGCATYCHTGLTNDDPWQNYTGTGVVGMHTNLAGDTADIWHWKASRTEPSGFVDDKWIEHATGTLSGRRSDAGTAAYSNNNLIGGNPEWMHQTGLNYTGDALFDFQSVLFGGTPMPGDEVPRYRSVVPSGSRGDVQTAATFDPITKHWTVEFKRLRDTGNADDHSFEDPAAAAPTVSLVVAPDAVVGKVGYDTHCMSCHQADGIGLPDVTSWVIPMAQRTSGSLIYTTVRSIIAMQSLEFALSNQEIEDIAAYLQGQGRFGRSWTVTVNVVGTTAPSAVTSEPAGIDCPSTCVAEFMEQTPVMLSASYVPGYVFTGFFGGLCSGPGDCGFEIDSNVTVSAVFELDCNGNGIPDDQDISGGASPDLDLDGIPDECLTVNYCNGDGGDQMGCTNCPCMNNAGAGTQGGCLNSALTSARLLASGDTSVSLPLIDTTDLRFSLIGAPPSAFCILNSGDSVAPTNPANPCFGLGSGAQAVHFDGLRCAVVNTRRHGGRSADSNGAIGVTNNPWGGEGGPPAGIAGVGVGFVAGQTRYFQVINRDDPLLSCMRGLNTSQAVEITFTP